MKASCACFFSATHFCNAFSMLELTDFFGDALSLVRNFFSTVLISAFRYEKSNRRGSMGYEETFYRFLQGIMSDVERRIRRGHERLALNAKKEQVFSLICVETWVCDKVVFWKLRKHHQLLPYDKDISDKVVFWKLRKHHQLLPYDKDIKLLISIILPVTGIIKNAF